MSINSLKSTLNINILNISYYVNFAFQSFFNISRIYFYIFLILGPYFYIICQGRSRYFLRTEHNCTARGSENRLVNRKLSRDSAEHKKRNDFFSFLNTKRQIIRTRSRSWNDRAERVTICSASNVFTVVNKNFKILG